MKPAEKTIRFHIKIYVLIIIIGLAISGITAFPLETELAYLVKITNNFPSIFKQWLATIYAAIKNTNQNFPYLSYGTDWLAFAHVMLAVLFIGPYKDPVKNKWIIEFGIVCCMAIIPLALIAGNIRQIPFFWQLIDCSFGVIAIVPLFLTLKKIKTLEKINAYEIYI